MKKNIPHILEAEPRICMIGILWSDLSILLLFCIEARALLKCVEVRNIHIVSSVEA